MGSNFSIISILVFNKMSSNRIIPGILLVEHFVLKNYKANSNKQQLISNSQSLIICKKLILI